MIIEKWFSTPIMHHVLEKEQLDNVQKEIDVALPYIRQDDMSNPWGDSVKTSFKHGNFHPNLFEKFNIKVLPKIIDELKNNFLTSFKQKDFESYKIIDSWLNISTRGGFQFEHSHTTPRSFRNYALSGVYYHQTTGDDGLIEFVSPNTLQASNITFFGSQYIAYKPQIGKILLFPSWLRHRVTINNTDSERISISFNIGH